MFHLHHCYPESCGESDGIHCTNHKDVTCQNCLERMKPKMNFTFPRTRFVDTTALYSQLQHLMSEVDELRKAYLEEETERVAEELMDVIHSAETFARKLQEQRGVNLFDVCRSVERKNMERGYYQ